MTKKLSRLIIDISKKRGIFMSNHVNQKKAETESIAESFYGFFQYLLSGILWVYMLLMLVVLPFYFTQGYVSIGTDKADFLRQWSIRLGRILVPVLVIYCGMRAAVYFQKKGLADFKGMNVGRLRTIFREHFSVTDVFAALYGCSLLISYVCSDYKEQAVWGATGWYMGLLPQLIMLFTYFLVSRAWLKSKWVFYMLLLASAVEFLLGCLNRFGIYFTEMEGRSIYFIGTIGNTNWYCGYLVTVFFGGVACLWQGAEGKVRRRLLILYVFIGFASLITQGSASGIFTLAVMLVVLFCLSGSDGRRMQNFWQIALILSSVCLLTYVIRRLLPGQMSFEDAYINLLTKSSLTFIMTIVSVICLIITFRLNKKGNYSAKTGGFISRILGGAALTAFATFVGLIIFNTLCPGKISALSGYEIFTFSHRWGSSRGATWEAGIRCFLEQDGLHKLVGAGPDCMSGFLYQDGSEKLLELVRKSFGMATLTNAHNEWLTVLVDMGIFGAVSYIGMVTSAIVRYIRAGKKNWIAGACGFCLLAYTVNNMFSFQQTMNVTTIFIIWGVGEAYLRSSKTSPKHINP